MEETSKILTFNNKEYEVDWLGFLNNPDNWDENFAEGTALNSSITGGLSDEHWRVIHYIRDSYVKLHVCPNIYSTCRNNDLKLKDLRRLFPTGYHRGACKISGITYIEGYLKYYYSEKIDVPEKKKESLKIYRVDPDGFLIFSEDWDENFATKKAVELKMATPLTTKHWEIINFLRNEKMNTGEIPNIYSTCDKFNIELEELETLFPDGYHRGAIKISGLRLR